MNPTPSVPKLAHKKDMLILGILLTVTVLAGFFFFCENPGKTATVRINGEPVQTISLHQEGQYTLENNGHTLTLLVENQTVSVVSSTCKDKLCQKAGALQNQGSCAVCLPAAISVTVNGDSPPDGITY